MNDLYRTYESNQALVAKDLESGFTLLPIAHSTQNAQIEIVLSEEGNFKRADIIPKKEAVTIIPVTEDSAARGNGNNPHPLADKLEYIAGDYSIYTDIDNTAKFSKYLKNISNWSNSENGCMQVRAIRDYVAKKRMIRDLIDTKVLELEDGILSNRKIEGIVQREAFVRFSVEPVTIESLDQESRVYRNKVIFKAYVDYYISQQGSVDLCYATGQTVPCSDKHPSKIRNTADKSKLVSANDTSGFAYRGRLSDSKQVASVGYETSQKAHNALRWVIGKQGFSIGEMTVVVWEIYGKDIIRIDQDTPDALFDETEDIGNFTNEAYAKRLELAAKGYRQNLDSRAEVVILGLEAATIGRLSVSFYKKLLGSEFMERILNWHQTCFWKHDYKYVKKADGKFELRSFVGAPSPKDIAETAFGGKNEKLTKVTVERLLPCIIDKRAIPNDIIKASINRATNPNGYDSRYGFEKAVSVTCALIRKKRFDKNKEEWSMGLDRTNADRSYLYGRLLGAAQKLEEVALYYAKEKGRDTSAERFMQQFVRKPVKTWGTISNNLRPYISRLNVSGKTYYVKELESIYDLFQADDFMKQEPLSELFLLGYNCQLNSYKKENKQESMCGNKEVFSYTDFGNEDE